MFGAITAMRDSVKLRNHIRTCAEIFEQTSAHLLKSSARHTFEHPRAIDPDSDWECIKAIRARLNPTPAEWDLNPPFDTIEEVNSCLAGGIQYAASVVNRYRGIRGLQMQSKQKGFRDMVIRQLQDAEQYQTLAMSSFRGARHQIDTLPITEHYATGKQMHACGTTACLSGHVRLNAEISDFVSFDLHATAARAVIESEFILNAPDTLAGILNVPVWFADMMIYNYRGDHDVHILYAKDYDQVTAADVITLIERLETMSPLEIYPHEIY